MTAKLFRIVVVLACLLGWSSARAEFKDIKVDLTNANLLTADEKADKSLTTFGVAVAADGSVSRVAADDASAAIVLSGKYHSDEHGWGNFSSTVSVEGPVKISMGSCNWGGNVTVKNEAGETVATFNTYIPEKCYHQNKADNIASTIYKGDAATLTISGGSYTPYIAVEAVDPSSLIEDATVTFSFGDMAECGLLPAAEKVEIGKSITIPANFTLYQEGKTLTGWTDGTNIYEIADEVKVEKDLTLTPVFTDNTVSLADRKEPVTVRWDFQRQNGAPTVGFQNVTGFWVTQVKIGDQTIDVKTDFDTNNGGKIANANWNDWAQMNAGTTFVLPACDGAVVTVEAYSAPTTTTIDGQPLSDGSKTPSFTLAGKLETVDLVIGDGSYYSYIQVVLPVVAAGGNTGGKTYTDEPASVIWPFNASTEAELATSVATPENAYSFTAVDLGGATVMTATTATAVDENNEKVVFSKLQPANGASDVVEWSLKPAKGLVFTPKKVSAYIVRYGTDSENGVNVTAKKAGGESVSLGTFTALRNNKTKADDKYSKNANLTDHFEIELTEAQQAALASGEGFSLFATIGVGNAKQGGFSDVRIEGVLNGTVEDVEKYTLEVKSNIEDAGTVTVYPKADEYDAGSKVKLSVEKNFGYAFVNWTDADNKVISEEPQFTYTVEANAVITANFKALNTYELAYSVAGGANDYQVELTPAPTVVDGKNMYEEGVKVTLKAVSNPVVKFTNWADGQSSSEITVVMDADHTDLVANFDALDFIAGWDFYRAGANGRPADFAAADNDADALVLRNAAGESQGWLDKSQMAAGGYEGRPAAVNWRTTGLGDYYWQTKINAEAFTDLKLITAMLYNYNAYQKYDVEYSLDGENWTKIGTITMEGAKNWKDAEFDFPAEANNQKDVYVRWIADKTSTIDGTKSDNDGATLGASFIIGSAKLINDGKAPELLSQVPEEGSETASINGKIVLTFDEKVKVKEGTTGKLGAVELTPSVTGKSVMFEYKNLTYDTPYTFTLAAGSIMDLTDNALDQEIKISFTTKTRPVVDKSIYDAEVSTVDEFVAALDAAAKRDDKTKRFRIFLHDGTYKMPASDTKTKTGNDKQEYPDPTTYINTPNISFIGESTEGVVITNTVPAGGKLEGIGNGDVLSLEKNATNCYFQNLTIKSAMGDENGRDIELNDKSDKTIFKDACLWGYQDTYVSNNDKGRFYFEDCLLRGRTDFLCGKGDVFYKNATLQVCPKIGGYIAVPSIPKKYGYVFKDCEIVAESSDLDGNFTLGRPWGSGTPIAVFIDTKMTAKPSKVGWNEMSNGWPARFAEYNSFTAAGTVIDLADRKKVFGDGHANNPVLTAAEAAEFSYSNVMGGDDDWDPAADAEQAPAPENVEIDGDILSWDNNDYVSLWAVCKNGKVIGFTLEPTFTVELPKAKSEDVYTVRAANEMGGLGEAVKAVPSSSISDLDADNEVVSTVYYNIQGMTVKANTPGVLIKVDTLASGKTVTTKIVVK